MKNNPLISVVVPIYNTSKYLPRCLNSIINQTYKNLEIICINDGSTDNSLSILQNYAQKDSRIKITTQKNAGLSAARNTGIIKSTGKYITFVDSDDEISHNMLEKLLVSLQKNDADISICSFKEIYPDGKITHFNKVSSAQTYTTEQSLKAMLREQGFMLSATMKLFPTTYFKNIQFPIGKLHEDIGTTYKLIMKARRVTFVPEELYFYHHHSDSIISKKFDKRKLDIITLKNITNERRMRARFSILRQIPTNKKKTKKILQYLRTHKPYITKNPEATKTDKFALALALFNPKLFQLAYKIKKS